MGRNKAVKEPMSHKKAVKEPLVPKRRKKYKWFKQDCFNIRRQ